jgi:hypothetical protein
MLIKRLHEASQRLDRILTDVLRLHHRRGIRERYITRIEGLLRGLAPMGRATDALLPIVASRGNAMGDWLTILAWASQVKQSRTLSENTIQQLDRALRGIRDIGAPHLFGPREKWDDAWNVHNATDVWDELSSIAAIIHNQTANRPLDLATAQYQTDLCLSRLSQGHCIMVMTYAGEDPLLWYFIGDKYKQISIPWAPVREWYASQLKYAQQLIDLGTFTAALSKLISALALWLDDVFTDIADAGCGSLRFIEDCFNDIPLIEFALRNARLSARMAVGKFEVRMVPALVEPVEVDGVISTTAAIIDHQENLLLAPFEAACFVRAAGLPPAAPLADEGNLELLLSGYDALVVSTHGHSLKFFTDAYFAQLGSSEHPHQISLAALQEAAPDLQLRLILVNACYSGSRSSRNLQTQFRTSDSVAIPNIFLLNRKAVALAGMWKISDTACFTLTHLVGEGLKLGLAPSAALARAIARMRLITRSVVIKILTENLSDLTQVEALRRISDAPESGMFSNPYFTAGFTIHGLL